MSKLMLFIRDRYHPLFHLRKFKIFQIATRLLDIPFGFKFDQVDHKIFLSLSKNLSFFLAGNFTEAAEKDNFIKIVKEGNFQSFLDVGANIGYYSFLFRSLAPGSRIVMVEPDKANLELLRKTISKFAADIKLIESAASDSDGTVDFYLDEVSGATGSISSDSVSFVTRHHKITPKKITVEAITIDTVAARHGAPDFIKIDVEAAELLVLKGALKTLSQFRSAVFFECDSKDPEISDIFASNGYVIFDFVSMRRTHALNHNNLALHHEKHAKLISLIQ